jgi:hypothetical protein
MSRLKSRVVRGPPPVAVHSRLRHRRDPLPIGARVVERNGREAAVLATLSAIRLAAVVAAPIGSLVARVFPATIDRRGYARKNLRLT